MNEYIIYCTEEQTKKALELGAPIEVYNHFDSSDIREANIFYKDKFIELSDGKLAERTTSEQMIGWLEDKFICSIEITFESNPIKWKYENWGKNYDYYDYEDGFSTRKEATIAAIDAALVYLNIK